MADRSLGFSVSAVDKASATFAKLALSVDRLERQLSALDRKSVNVKVDADTSKAQAKIATLDKSFGASTIRIAALGRAMGSLALPGALVAAAPAIASLGASAVQASGAMWLLPAAAVAGGVAFGALKVGMAGFGDAMKNLDDPAKFAEAIAKLSPAARDAANAVRGLVPEWTAMQQVVQQNLFAGVAASIGDLAGKYLPILQAGLGGTAVELNRLALGVAGFFAQAQTMSTVAGIFEQVRLAMAAMSGVGASLASIFVDIAAVGATFLPGLAGGFAAAAAAAAAFIANARATGQLAVWIQNGLNVLAQLGRIAGNVGSILKSVFDGAASSGASFLGTLDLLTARIATALKTPAGAGALQDFFGTVRTLVGLLVDKLVQLWPVVVAAGGAFAALLVAAAPLSNVIFGLVVAGLVPLLDTIRFLAPVLGPALVIFGALAAVTRVWTIASGIATAASFAFRTAMGAQVVATDAQAAAQKRHTVATTLGTAAGYVARGAMATWAAAQWALTAAMNGTLIPLVAQKVAAIALATWSGIVRGAMAAWTAVQWLLNAALSANPIALVVIAIAALVAGLIWAWNSSETFRAVVIAVWNALKTAAIAVFTFLVNFFVGTWNNIRNTAITVWNAVSAFFVGAFAVFTAFFAAVWNGIVAVFSGVWNFIRTVAVNVWNGIVAFFAAAFAYYQAFFAAVWNTISSIFTGVWNFIRNTAVTVWNAIVAYFQAGFAYYQAFFAAVWNAISFVFMTVWNFIRNTAVTVWTAIAAFFTTAFAAFTAFFAFIWNAIWTFFVNTWNNLRNTAVNAWNAIYAFFSSAFAVFTQFFTDTWNNIVGAFDRIWSGITAIATRVWDAVKGAFVGAINWIIDKINFFAGAINKVAGLLGFNINLHVDRLALGGEVEAVRRALGGTIEAKQVIRRATGGGINAAGGGLLPGRNKPGRDMLPAFAGSKPYRLDGGEYVTRREATAAVGPAGMAAVNNAHRQPVDIVPRGALERQALYMAGGAVGLATGGQLAAAASKGVPGTRASNTFRPGDPGMHGKNQAADLVGDLPRINRWIADTHGRNTTQLIYTPGINLLNGRPHRYNAATQADHFDHVHWGMAGSLLGGGIQGLIGGLLQSGYESLLSQAGVLLNPLKDILVPIRDDGKQNYGMRFGAGLGIKILDNLFTKASEQDAAMAGGGGMDVSGISGPVVEQVRQVAHRYGWGAGPEWDAIMRLVQKESGWNPGAANPTSSARGLFQKMTSLHGPVEPTAAGQAAWGLNYIRGRYGSPSAAMRFHNANNHYDRGGVARGQGVMFKDVITPERVLSGRQTVAFEELVSGLTSGRPQRRVGDVAVLERIAATQSARRTPALTGPGGDGIAVNIGTLSTPPGTTAGEMAGVLRREMRVAKHGGRYRR